jgi:hypothetical protein
MASRDINEPQHALRFLDVDEEPLSMLPGIPDYENTPLVSLNKAVVPLQLIVTDIKRMVQTVTAKRDEPTDGLTKDESNSIRLYSLEWQPRENSVFYILNKALRSENRQQLTPWFLFLRLILTALSHLTSNPLTVYRGINLDLAAKYPTGASTVWWGFASCMKKNNLLEKRLFLNKTGKRTLFVINCYSGKGIQQHTMYESEDEVLLPPGCQFNVVNCANKGEGLSIVELKEIQPAYDFLNAFSTSTDVSTNTPIYTIQFQPISTVSLSKKSLPAALPDLGLEEHFAYLKQRTKVDLKSKNLTDSDMDIVVSEIVIKRQCLELHLSENKITSSGILIIAHVLRKNKVKQIISSYSLLDIDVCLKILSNFITLRIFSWKGTG